MASEQAAGRAVYGSDLYSLGLTAVYALTGKIPQELPTDGRTGDIQWRSFAPTVSGGLAAAIDRAIAPHSRDRCQTSGQMLDELLRSDSLNSIPGTVPSLSSSPIPTQISPLPLTNSLSKTYQPTIVVAHPPNYSSQPESVASIPVPKSLSVWAKTITILGLVGGFVLIALFITRPQQAAQVANNATVPSTTTSVAPSQPAVTPSQPAVTSSQPAVVQTSAPVIDSKPVAAISPIPSQILPESTPSSPEREIPIKALDKPGLYLASTTLKYDDGDQLKADFRVYCPSSTIRPTNYVLVNSLGNVKKQGAWWENSFTPKYNSEYLLIKQVCSGN